MPYIWCDLSINWPVRNLTSSRFVGCQETLHLPHRHQMQVFPQYKGICIHEVTTKNRSNYDVTNNNANVIIEINCRTCLLIYGRCQWWLQLDPSRWGVSRHRNLTSAYLTNPRVGYPRVGLSVSSPVRAPYIFAFPHRKIYYQSETDNNNLYRQEPE